MIIFKNPGEIDVRAIKILGVCAKENPSAIGFFGTGLKYAIAVLLRENQQITIYSGVKKYKFTKKTFEMRGKTFEAVCINGREMGFTTELGKTWKMWQAYRELHCNTTDEKGQIGIQGNSVPIEGIEGYTIITVKGKTFAEAYNNRHETILPELLSSKGTGAAEIRDGVGKNIYYRNIRVHELSRPSLYTYNIKAAIDLTEDRTAKYEFQIKAEIIKLIVLSADSEFIEEAVTAEEGYFESTLNLKDTYLKPSETFMSVLAKLKREKKKDVNNSALTLHSSYSGGSGSSIYEITDLQRKQLDQAIDFIDRLGFPEIRKYPILALSRLANEDLSGADKGTIFVSAIFFNRSLAEMVNLLIERLLNVHYALESESREMQNFLLGLFVNLKSEGKEVAA